MRQMLMILLQAFAKIGLAIASALNEAAAELAAPASPKPSRKERAEAARKAKISAKIARKQAEIDALAEAAGFPKSEPASPKPEAPKPEAAKPRLHIAPSEPAASLILAAQAALSPKPEAAKPASPKPEAAKPSQPAAKPEAASPKPEAPISSEQEKARALLAAAFASPKLIGKSISGRNLREGSRFQHPEAGFCILLNRWESEIGGAISCNLISRQRGKFAASIEAARPYPIWEASPAASPEAAKPEAASPKPKAPAAKPEAAKPSQPAAKPEAGSIRIPDGLRDMILARGFSPKEAAASQAFAEGIQRKWLHIAPSAQAAAQLIGIISELEISGPAKAAASRILGELEAIRR